MKTKIDSFLDVQYNSMFLGLRSKPGGLAIINQLNSRVFKFHSSKLAQPQDILVHTEFKDILLSEYNKKVFLDTSHGDRPNKSCHTALQDLRNWNDTTWVIKGELPNNWDNHRLAEILSMRILDKNILDFYWKLVNAGYVEKTRGLYSNIFYHEFDAFMDQQIDVKYIRYANHWFVGLNGPYKKVEEVGERITHFLSANLQLILGPSHMEICNIQRQSINYLGYRIKGSSLRPGCINLYLPLVHIVKALELRGFSQDFKGKRYGQWIHLTDYEIIVKYRAMLIELLLFYSLADDLVARFNGIAHILLHSAAHTLANKHNCSRSSIFKSHGRTIQVASKGLNTVADLNWKDWLNYTSTK